MRDTITQEHEMGCGAACVAFAVGISYQQAANILGKTKAMSVGFYLKDLREVLSKHGLDYKSTHVKPHMNNIIRNDGTIVFIKRSKRYPYGHYLIRHGNLWMDPWIILPYDKNVTNAKSGYRKKLPGKAQWALLPNSPAELKNI